MRNGIRYYETAITKFLGNSLIKRLENLPAGAGDDEIRAALRPTCPIGQGYWADLAGLLAPKEAVDSLLDSVERGETGLQALFDGFHQMHNQYYDAEWTWVYDKYARFFAYPLEQVTADQVADIVRRWNAAVIGLDKELYEDARKEFNLASMTGFGADGDKVVKERDFSEVRGDFESNSFVNAVLAHIRDKEALGNNLLQRLGKSV